MRKELRGLGAFALGQRRRRRAGPLWFGCAGTAGPSTAGPEAPATGAGFAAQARSPGLGLDAAQEACGLLVIRLDALVIFKFGAVADDAALAEPANHAKVRDPGLDSKRAPTHV